MTAAVAELERFLGKTQPLYLERDVASGALQQDGLAEVVDADRWTVCELVCRRENATYRSSNSNHSSMRAGRSCTSPTIATLISPSSKSSTSFSAAPSRNST